MKATTPGEEVSELGTLDHLGGRVAINFLNTSRMQEGSPIDTLQTDFEVKAWMKRMKLPEPVLDRPMREGTLLLAARHLRDVTLEAIRFKKSGKRFVPSELNRLLALSKSHLVLGHAKDKLQLLRSYSATNAAEYLAPLMEEIADLLAHGDFNLIRQCEGDVCVLWFLDQTKGHRRRWCAAGSCGTRARVAAFRARRAAVAQGV